MTETDLELLKRYDRSHDEESFAEVVRRRVNLVYSAALRQVRCPQLSEEVAQSVFTDLARNAHRLAPDTILTAWLYQVTRRTAIDVVRRESRRQLREQIATEMNAINATTDDWMHVEPMLDEAMHALDETDRAAVLLRYFENKSLREVGQTLGTSDDAAQKRVSRAVERLREFFAKRGVTVGASGLVVVISANAVQAAPASLAVTISTTAALAGTTLATTATTTTIKTIAMTTLQKTLITTAIVGAVGGGIYEARQAATLHGEAQVLRREQAGRIQQMQREGDELSNRLAGVLAENSHLKSSPDRTEILKLRGEVAQLREELKGLPRARVVLLKQKLEEMPDKRIPELQFLIERDWANAAWDADLETDDGTRLAFRNLRDKAVDKFLNLMRTAFKSYLVANNGTLPANLSELKDYFQTPVTDEMLGHYKLLQTGKLNPDWSESLVSKIFHADPEYDSNQAMSMSGGGGASYNRIQEAIEFAANAFAADHAGQIPGDSSQILPYLKTQIDPAAIQKHLNEMLANPPPPELATLAPSLKAYAEAHNGEYPKQRSDLLPYLTTSEQKAALQKLEQEYKVQK